MGGIIKSRDDFDNYILSVCRLYQADFSASVVQHQDSNAAEIHLKTPFGRIILNKISPK